MQREALVGSSTLSHYRRDIEVWTRKETLKHLPSGAHSLGLWCNRARILQELGSSILRLSFVQVAHLWMSWSYVSAFIIVGRATLMLFASQGEYYMTDFVPERLGIRSPQPIPFTTNQADSFTGIKFISCDTDFQLLSSGVKSSKGLGESRHHRVAPTEPPSSQPRESC